MNRQSVEVRIDELVLHGFERRDRSAVADSLRVELQRLLTATGVPGAADGDRAVARVDAGTVTLPAGSGPGDAGVGAARAVYAGLRR